MDNSNKEVLITGSNRGIGKAIAEYLSDNGYNIVLHCSKNSTHNYYIITDTFKLRLTI